MNRRSFSLQSCCLFFLLQLIATAALAQMPALSPLPGTGDLSNPSDPQKLTFVLAGDNRPAKSSCEQPPVPGKIFDAIKAMNPSAAFVLWTGDTISGKEPDKKTLKGEYDKFLDLARKAGVPVFNAPGNHEMDNGDNVPNQDMKDFYKKYMKQAETYGAFNFGNSRFIALDSENEPDSLAAPAAAKTQSSAKSKSDAPGAITAKQLNLLAQDLKQNADKAHIIIFMHHPVKPYSSKDGLDPVNAKALKDILKGSKNVSYVISGHEHMYYNPLGPKSKVTDPPRVDPSSPGPYYLVSGGGGAPPKNTKAGSFFHYLIFNVDGPTITPTLVQIGSCVACKKTDKCDPCSKLGTKEEPKCASFN